MIKHFRNKPRPREVNFRQNRFITNPVAAAQDNFSSPAKEDRAIPDRRQRGCARLLSKQNRALFHTEIRKDISATDVSRH